MLDTSDSALIDDPIDRNESRDAIDHFPPRDLGMQPAWAQLGGRLRRSARARRTTAGCAVGDA